MKTPTAIGPYPVLRVVAQGGMSVVYEVADPATGATYAAKVLDSRLLDDPRFEQEYIALARVDHPNIVRGLRYGRTEEGAPYLVLELIFGLTAQARAKSVGRPGDPARTAEAVRIAHDVASAVAHMHAHGLVHRDLKSNNVIVSADGHVKLLDFGTVRLMRGGVAFTRRGDFVGTFAYAAPEQLTGGPVGPPADLYALGVLLYRMLTGKKPFDGPSPEAVARAQLEYIPPPPSEVVPDIPEALSMGVMHLLQKQAQDRPSGAQAVAQWLAPMLPPGLGKGAAPARIGRGDQLARVDAALTEAVPGQVLLFAGVPDADPPHHLRRATDEAGRRGMRVLRLDAAAEGLEDLRATVADLLPDLAGLLEAEGPGLDLRALANALGVQATLDKMPVVLAISGTERAARPVVARLFELADACREANVRVLLLMTWGPHPPARPGLSMIRVAPLTASEVVEIARRRLGVAGIPPERVRRLLELCGGRPSILEDLLEARETEVPERLAQSYTAALGRLSRTERRMVEVVARCQGDAEAGTLAWAADLSPESAGPALEALAREGWVSTEGRPRVVPGVLREVVRSSTRRLRDQLYADRLAERAAELSPGEARVQALLDAGRRREALVALLEERAPARVLFDRLMAEPPAPELGVRAWVAYGHRLVADGDVVAVERALARAGEGVKSQAERAEVSMLGAALARAKGNIDAEIRYYNDAVRTFEIAGQPARAASARVGLAETLRRIGELERAEMTVRAAVKSGGDAVALAQVLLDRGQLREAEALFAEALGRWRAGEGEPWRAATGFVRACRHQGRWSAAYALLREVMPRARAEADRRRLARLLLAHAEMDVDLYRIGQAREALDEIRAIHDGDRPEHLRPALGRVAARIHSLVGEPDEALRVLDETLELAVQQNYSRASAELRAQRAAVAATRDGPDAWRRDFASARDVLLIYGAFPALARICGMWAEAAGGADPPDWIYRGASGWIDREPALPARLERALAALRTARRRNEMVENRRLDAFLLLDSLREGLSPEDAGALDVHPYASEVRKT